MSEDTQLDEFKRVLQAKMNEFSNKLFGVEAVESVEELVESTDELVSELESVAVDMEDHTESSEEGEEWEEVFHYDVESTNEVESDLAREQRQLREELGF